MKLSAVANFNPFSKLHPPLPRTPRQSEQLLDALTSSFRRELDREHPPTASSSNQSPRVNNALAGGRPTKDDPYSSSHAADKHFRTILDNPLFRLAPSGHSVRSEHSPNTKSVRLSKEPMVVFDELVASGSATVGAVADCLRWQVLLASRHTGDRFLKELKDSRAGSRTASWWLTLDSTARISFFRNQKALIPQLCKFMVVEGLHDTVFVWLRALRDCMSDDQMDQRQMTKLEAYTSAKHLVGLFLKAEIDYGGGMGASLRLYLDACRMLMSVSDEESKLLLRRKVIVPSAGYLLSFIMKNGHKNTKDTIPVDVYESYMTMVSTLAQGTLSAVVIPIYHPTYPDAKPFAQFVRDTKPTDIASWPETRRDRIIRAGLDSLRILADTGKSKDSLYVARFLQEILGEEREAETTAPWHYVSSEEKAQITSWDLTFT
ncbi:hypothetical protein BDW62DRAFT_107233 [Aspergillus aurantiobrunneus]